MLYQYEAMDLSGRVVTGTQEAGSPADARATLVDRGLVAYRVDRAAQEAAPAEGRRAAGVSWLNLSGRRLDLLTRLTCHLALLLRTGLPLAQALEVLALQAEDRRFRNVLGDVASKVKEGLSFDAALACHPRYFPDLYIHVARAGAAAGELPAVLDEISRYYVRQKKLRDKVVSALTYPALMGAVGVLVLVFLLSFVVPRVTAVLLEQKKILPWPTEVLLAASALVTEGWWLIVPGLFVMGLCIRKLLATAWGRRMADRLMIAIPVVGGLMRKQAVARWAGTMSTLLASGIPVAQALSVVCGSVGNQVLADDVGRLEKEVLEGASLSEALKRSRVLPPSVGFIAGVGEEAGELPHVFRQVADNYNDEVEVASGRLTDLLNPVLIVVLGIVVAFIVAAILLPITDFSKIQ